MIKGAEIELGAVFFPAGGLGLAGFFFCTQLIMSPFVLSDTKGIIDPRVVLCDPNTPSDAFVEVLFPTFLPAAPSPLSRLLRAMYAPLLSGADTETG